MLNIRYQNIIFFNIFAIINKFIINNINNIIINNFNINHFILKIVSLNTSFINNNMIVKYNIFQIVKQAINKGILKYIFLKVKKTI